MKKRTMNSSTATTTENRRGSKLKLAYLFFGGVAAGVGTGLLIHKMKKSGKLLDGALNQEDADREDFEEDNPVEPEPDETPTSNPEPAPTTKPEGEDHTTIATKTTEKKGDDKDDSIVYNSVDGEVGGDENIEDKPQKFQPSALVTEEEARILNQLYVKYTTGTDTSRASIRAFRYICRLEGIVSLANDRLGAADPVIISAAKDALTTQLKRLRAEVGDKTLLEVVIPLTKFIDDFIPRMNSVMDAKIEELRKETPEPSGEKREA